MSVQPSLRRTVAAVASAALLAGCAATPTRDAPSPDDPFEPMNRVSYSVHEVVDGHFVKPMVQTSVEAFARKQGYETITLQVMDDSKNDSPNGMSWTPEAQQRLDNIPDFIRPMARKEIERLAKERGVATITAQVMDDAKDKFMKFM